MEVATELSTVEKARQLLRNELLDHLSLSKDAHFRSQQVRKPKHLKSYLNSVQKTHHTTMIEPCL